MTAFTKTYIANLALAHHGEYRINNIDDSDDPSAIVIRDHWDIARLDALGAFEWGFASTIEALTRSSEVPAAGFQYKYDQPANWVRTNKVSDSTTFSDDGAFMRWEYRGGFFETDAEALYVDFVYDHTTVGAWPPWFVVYMAAKLAAWSAPGIITSSVTASELHKMADRLLLNMKGRDAQQRVKRRPPTGRWYQALRGQRTWK